MELRRTGVLLAALALTLTGCRGGGDVEAGEIDAPGVTSEPCPDAVNEDNGCIYLGTISDLTQGPFAPLGVPITEMKSGDDIDAAYARAVAASRSFASTPT